MNIPNLIINFAINCIMEDMEHKERLEISQIRFSDDMQDQDFEEEEERGKPIITLVKNPNGVYEEE